MDNIMVSMSIRQSIKESAEDILLQLLLQISDHLFLYLIQLVQFVELDVGLIYLVLHDGHLLFLQEVGEVMARQGLEYVLVGYRGKVVILWDGLLVVVEEVKLRMMLVLGIVLGICYTILLGIDFGYSLIIFSYSSHFPSIKYQAFLLFRPLKLHKNMIKNFLDGIRNSINDLLYLSFSQIDADSLQHSGVEGIPVLYFFAEGVGWWIVVKLDDFGVVVVYEFCHHDCVCEISVDAFLGPGEVNAVDHGVDFLQLLFVHDLKCYKYNDAVLYHQSMQSYFIIFYCMFLYQEASFRGKHHGKQFKITRSPLKQHYRMMIYFLLTAQQYILGYFMIGRCILSGYPNCWNDRMEKNDINKDGCG